jgi:hypothetical protein
MAWGDSPHVLMCSKNGQFERLHYTTGVRKADGYKVSGVSSVRAKRPDFPVWQPGLWNIQNRRQYPPMRLRDRDREGECGK